MTSTAYETWRPKSPSRWMITADHARNHVPHWINNGDLGLPTADMQRHIAYDIGVEGVARHMAREINARLLISNFSRMVIDPNRGQDDPTLLMQIYDGSIIPENRGITPEKAKERLERLYLPYHQSYDAMADERDDTIICAIHSFTPQLNNRPRRPWEIGILYANGDDMLARPMIDMLRSETDWSIGENEPYSGHLEGDSIDRHALQKGRPNLLIEIRNDLIETDAGQAHWAQALAPFVARITDFAKTKEPA